MSQLELMRVDYIVGVVQSGHFTMFAVGDGETTEVQTRC
jgi:hypothetical protein